MSSMRLDQLLVARGLVESREKAQRLIRAGKVRVGGRPAAKPGHEYPDDAILEVEAPERFVSRGGEKLEEAFRQFQPAVEGLVCLDVGASTGGFTDCLLQHGAARVYAVDVGKGQLHWKIRTDPRVVVFEGVNARFLEARSLPETPVFVVIDVSFISLTKILPAVTQVLAAGGHIVSLIKPQFEAGRNQVEKGGVVRDPAVHERVIETVRAFGVQSAGLEFLGVCRSPLLGPAGNVEFLAYWKKP
ncbi:MAG TPA: TlyA family rRNA (cytidine-2'-O)-methyltransferase [Verrucomicrobia bacterium]|nr:MAG: rRNA methyltransferase [Lentisphaerae bacterium GWF2_57_35]HBA83448.1 TlyA family rRNA (cytidine-2'-O)-methyltransferase [Verrucomicrobiota bacterium]